MKTNKTELPGEYSQTELAIGFSGLFNGFTIVLRGGQSAKKIVLK